MTSQLIRNNSERKKEIPKPESSMNSSDFLFLLSSSFLSFLLSGTAVRRWFGVSSPSPSSCFFSHSSISCVYVIEFSIATGCPPVNCAGIERNVHLAWFPQGQCFKLSNLFKAESVSLSQTFLSSFFSLKLSSQECIISFLVSYHDS